jgi:hypothetical protein
VWLIQECKHQETLSGEEALKDEWEFAKLVNFWWYRASHLLGRHSPLKQLLQLCFMLGSFEKGSLELLALVGFET